MWWLKGQEMRRERQFFLLKEVKDRSEGETTHFKFLPLYVKCIIVPRLGCRLARPRRDRLSHNESLGVVRIKGSLVTMAQTTKHNEARAGQVACLQHLYPPLVTRAWDRTVSSTIDYRNSSIAPEISINLGLSNKLWFFFLLFVSFCENWASRWKHMSLLTQCATRV